MSSSSNLKPSTLAHHLEYRVAEGSALPEDIDRMCGAAAHYRFRSVAVPVPCVLQAVDRVRGTDVVVCADLGLGVQHMDREMTLEGVSRSLEHGAGAISLRLDSDALRGLRGTIEDERSTLEEVVRRCVKKPWIRRTVMIPVSELSFAQFSAALKMTLQVGVGFVGVMGESCVDGVTIDPVTTIYRSLTFQRCGTKIAVVNKALDELPKSAAGEADSWSVSVVEGLLAGGAEYVSTTRAVSIMRAAEQLAIR